MRLFFSKGLIWKQHRTLDFAYEYCINCSQKSVEQANTNSNNVSCQWLCNIVSWFLGKTNESKNNNLEWVESKQNKHQKNTFNWNPNCSVKFKCDASNYKLIVLSTVIIGIKTRRIIFNIITSQSNFVKYKGKYI